ncbi:MAG: DUF2288 domain-containing protein [Gallionella sp.]|nr:DUF2288 domain-containing protein [Gallionella sp.]
MTANSQQQEIYRAKLNLETSQIAWKELQRYFAGGVALAAADELDLVEVAYQVSADNSALIREWMEAGKFGKVSDEQAAVWYRDDAVLWAVVVSPWVLVQQARKQEQIC